MLLDALRGLALVWMTVFHFCFDLNYLGFWRQDFYRDPFWVWQRVGIVSIFLLCVGISQALVQARATPSPMLGPRWWRVAGCALLVSVASYLVFPRGYIYFGVLHCIAVVSVVLWWLRRWSGSLLLLVAALAIAAPRAYAVGSAALPAAVVQALNGNAGSVLGLITQLPRTEDYVPLLPWLGVAMLGLWAGRQLVRRGSASSPLVVAWPLRMLATLGRYSLPYYMLHQLVLMGALTALSMLLKA